MTTTRTTKNRTSAAGEPCRPAALIQRKQWMDSWLSYVAAIVSRSTAFVQKRAYEAIGTLLIDLDELDYNSPVRRELDRIISEVEAEAKRAFSEAEESIREAEASIRAG